METTNRLGVEKTEPQRNSSSEPDSGLQNRKGRFAHPTAEEVTRLTFGKYRDFRIHAQELRNHARILNQGDLV